MSPSSKTDILEAQDWNSSAKAHSHPNYVCLTGVRSPEAQDLQIHVRMKTRSAALQM